MITCYRTSDITVWLLNYGQRKRIYWIMILKKKKITLKNCVVITWWGTVHTDLWSWFAINH